MKYGLYKAALEGHTCPSSQGCGVLFVPAKTSLRGVPDPGGYEVIPDDESKPPARYMLFAVCPACKQETALWRIGITGLADQMLEAIATEKASLFVAGKLNAQPPADIPAKGKPTGPRLGGNQQT